MKKNVFLLAMFSMTLALGMTLTDNNKTPGLAGKSVGNLPAFEGSFVPSKEEATKLAEGAQKAIGVAIKEAMASGAMPKSLSDPRSGHYEHNGVVIDYVASTSDTQITINEVVTIDGAYSGYRIIGNYDIHSVTTSLSAQNSVMNYDYMLTVSKDGVGMKIVATGTVKPSATTSTTSNHYTIYDNADVRQYDYDYDHTYPIGE